MPRQITVRTRSNGAKARFVPPESRRLQGASAAVRDVYDHMQALQHASRKAGRGHWVRPRQDTIATALGYCRETVSRAIRELVRRGLLMVTAKFYRNAAGEIRRAANRSYVFVARAASAVVAFLAAKGRKPLQSADCDIALTQRAERSVHQRGPINFPKNKTAFLLAYERKDRANGTEQGMGGAAAS